MLLIAALTITIAGCTEVDPNAPDRTAQTTAEVTAPTVPSEPTEPTVDVQATGTSAPVISATAPVTSASAPVTTTASVTEKPVVTTQKPNRPSNTVWKEIPVPEHNTHIDGYWLGFDRTDNLTGYDSFYEYQFTPYIFKATVLSLKDYEVSWTDDSGNKIGPLVNGIIEVKVNKNYYGKSPAEGNVIKIALSYSVSAITYDSPTPVVGGEYVFLTRVLDENYTAFVEKFVPDYRGEDEKFADVIISGIHTSLPVENGYIAISDCYFGDSKETMKKSLSRDSIKNVNLIDSRFQKTSGFAIFTLDVFEQEFSVLIDNAKSLPVASSR
jgi:hypothetical protein